MQKSPTKRTNRTDSPGMRAFMGLPCRAVSLKGPASRQRASVPTVFSLQNLIISGRRVSHDTFNRAVQNSAKIVDRRRIERFVFPQLIDCRAGDMMLVNQSIPFSPLFRASGGPISLDAQRNRGKKCAGESGAALPVAEEADTLSPQPRHWRVVAKQTREWQMRQGGQRNPLDPSCKRGT